MAIKAKENLIAAWAFLIGVVLAIILGFVGLQNQPLWLWVFVVLGLIIGLLNVTGNEVQPFLMAGIVLIIASALGQDVLSSVSQLNGMLEALLAIFVPAVVIVAIRHVFSLARR